MWLHLGSFNFLQWDKEGSAVTEPSRDIPTLDSSATPPTISQIGNEHSGSFVTFDHLKVIDAKWKGREKERELPSVCSRVFSSPRWRLRQRRQPIQETFSQFLVESKAEHHSFSLSLFSSQFNFQSLETPFAAPRVFKLSALIRTSRRPTSVSVSPLLSNYSINPEGGKKEKKNQMFNLSLSFLVCPAQFLCTVCRCWHSLIVTGCNLTLCYTLSKVLRRKKQAY